MESTKRQLKLASAFVIGSGLFVLTGSWGPTSGLVRLYGEIMFWPGAEGVEIAKEANLLSAILGGVMTSWGLLYWFLTDLLETETYRVKRIFMVSIWVWFVADGLGSFAAGAYINLICNVGYLLIFVLPLRRISSPAPR